MSFGVSFPPANSAGRLMIWTLASTVLLLGLLEVWRPYYFLTDDNLSVGLPFLSEMGRHLKSGQSPFYSDYLYGGHYNLLRDANYFSWSPVNFAVSLLADTPARFAMLDVIGWLNMLLTAAGFALLAATVRRDLALDLTNGRLFFLTLSFTFSTFIMTTGASWVNFLANQSVLPWLALGLWQTRWRTSLPLLVFFSLHQALSGQSAGTISNGLILSLFAVLIAIGRRSWMPVLSWIIANVVTLILILPLLLPAMNGFMHSDRGAGISVELLNRFNVPAGLAPVSFLFGNFFEMGARFAHVDPNTLAILYFPRVATLLACAAAWCIFPLVCQRRTWTFLELSCAGLMAVLLVMIIRPIFITEIMSHLPIFRSMRWPFREILQLLFFYHFLLVLRPWAGTPVFQNRVACISLVLFALPLLFTAPLTFNQLKEDRMMVLSGTGDRYWNNISAQLRPGDQIATVIDPDLWYTPLNKSAYALMGTADFPAYFRIHCISGYSQTAPWDQLAIPVKPGFWFGAYEPKQIPLLTKNHPEVRVITVLSFDPTRIVLSPVNPGDPPINLLSFLPK